MYYFDRIVDDTFDIEKTLECGQCFHYLKKEDKNYIVFGAETFCEIQQKDNEIRIWTDVEYENYWVDYFALNEDYSSIIDKLKSHCLANGDDFGLQAIEKGMGIRILHQPYFETSCSYILSQQNNIRRISRMVFEISNLYGRYALDYKGVSYGYFPRVADLRNVSLEKLEQLGLGYRAKYLYEFVKNWFNIADKITFDYNNDFNLFKSCFGIGDKVSNCICLYGLNETDAFPIDVWMKKILKEEYMDKGFSFKIPDENAGILQQFMFYTKRLEKIK